MNQKEGLKGNKANEQFEGRTGKIQTMRHHRRKNGLKRLLNQGRKKFRIPENLDYYAAADFKAAERLFLKECIINDHCRK